ncbi:MAG: radical SAM protein, partial [candidate division NC10 bacterium]|nr:radical SAM protein [candidate division NC10 bacterium]
ERPMIQYLAQGMKEGVPGLIQRKGERFQVFSPSPSPDLDALPLPARDLLDLSNYLREGGSCNLQSKRGCAFRCTYCTYPLIEGRKVRLRDPKKVVAEMEGLQSKYGVDYFFFVDNIFNYPPDHGEAICREIVAQGLKMRWTCYAHPGYMSRNLADRMAEAGCESIEFGTDSGSASVLTALQKDFSSKQIKEASLACREAGIQFCHSLIFGAPGEDASSLDQTFQLMEEVDPTAVIAMIGVRIYPRTSLAERLVEEGHLRSDEVAYPPKFYLSPTLGEEVVGLVTAHAQRCRNWIVPGYNINYSVKLQRLFRRRGKMGPIWGYMRNLRGRGRASLWEGKRGEHGEG